MKVVTPSIFSVTLLTLVACNSGSNSHGGSPATPPKNNQSDTALSDNSQKDKGTPAGNLLENSVNNTSGCPWNIGDDPVAKKYKLLGVEITLDCSMAENYFQMNRSDINGPLRVLDDSSALFENWANKPTTIRIGGGRIIIQKIKSFSFPCVWADVMRI